MAKKRFLKVEFFRIEPADQQEFRDAVAAIAAKPNNEARNSVIGGIPVRLHQTKIGPQILQGNIVKIRMDEGPVRASLGGTLEPFDLDEDEGVGEETAFLYHKATGVLAVQRARYGLKASGIVDYFANVAELGAPFDIRVVLNADAVRKFNRLREVRRFEVKVAGADAGFFRDAGYSVKDMSKIVAAFGAPNVQLTLSMGHRHDSLNLGGVKAAVRSLLEREGQGARVTRLVVAGYGADDEPSVLDLVQDRMFELIQIPDYASREIPYGLREAALKEAFNTRRDELAAMFPGQ